MGTKIFDQYLLKKDLYQRRKINMDQSLYEELKRLAKEYEASINKLVNISILDFIMNEKVYVYEKMTGEKSQTHNFAIRKTSYTKLKKLKEQYHLSITKLINIAVYHAINE